MVWILIDILNSHLWGPQAGKTHITALEIMSMLASLQHNKLLTTQPVTFPAGEGFYKCKRVPYGRAA